MSLVSLQHVVFKCDAPECTRMFSFIKEDPKTVFPAWWGTVRIVNTLTGAEKAYCDRLCEVVAAQAGLNDAPSKSVVVAATPNQISAVASDAKITAGLHVV
jgi:hypothetical protein